jgi:hypothetical protein
MARIIVGSYMVRYPMGGMMSWVLQYLVGFQRLGHDVFFVEKSGYANACFNPLQGTMTNDCSHGIKVVKALLERFGLAGRWCFVDFAGTYHGLDRAMIEGIFNSADLFFDMGTHGAWLKEAENTRFRVLGDGEPGFTQMKWDKRLEANESLPEYDYYYTTGANIGKAASSSPTVGKLWRHVWHPVVPEMFPSTPVSSDAAFTTVMNWQSHPPLEYKGRCYGQKDLEFAKFMDLPAKVTSTLEVAVSGSVPRAALEQAGWRTRHAHDVTNSYDTFVSYIQASRGEFSVCKNVFVATNSGWFSDRSAVYLASGRPVVLEDTGFSAHLPCGTGLFAVRTVDEAAAAIAEVQGNFQHHSQRAIEIAHEYLAASRVLPSFLREVGI